VNVYVLTSEIENYQCIEGIFTSMNFLNRYKEIFPNKKYNEVKILKTDYFPENGKENIMYVELRDDGGYWSFITYKVELNEESKIGKLYRADYNYYKQYPGRQVDNKYIYNTDSGDFNRFYSYVYASDRNEAITKLYEILGRNIVGWDS